MAKKTFYNEPEIVFEKISTHGKFIDLTGFEFGILKIIGFAGIENKRTYHWYCKCKCGNIVKVESGNMKRGFTTSCGCVMIEKVRERRTTHGLASRQEGIETYRTWRSMIERCTNKKVASYQDYGGRGISVCSRWMNLENFLEDMGRKPNGLTLDRIDNNGNYCPENCRWTTQVQQCNNKRNNVNLTYCGKTQTISQWSRDAGINVHTLGSRIRAGWSTEKALTKKLSNRTKIMSLTN